MEERRLEASLALNKMGTSMFDIIDDSLNGCISFNFNIAFVSYSGLQLFLSTFEELKNKEVCGNIITSTYLNFTDPKALRKISEFNNIKLKVYNNTSDRGFHSKAYLFEYNDYYKIIIGSSNMTGSALKTNIEWNVQIISKKDDQFAATVISEFKEIWDSLEYIDDNFLEQYEDFIRKAKKFRKNNPVFKLQSDMNIEPNSMQKAAMKNLNNLRYHGEDRALAIAATGSGKTYMSVFDVQQVKPKKMLFLVHRNEILNKSLESFTKVLGANIKARVYNSNIIRDQNDKKDDQYVFANMSTMSRYYDLFLEDEFDYIIVDEAHHATNPSYEKMLNYFKPKFLLGMTATPERSDGGDIYALFNNNIAIEVRLQHALEDNLVVPFHYFGINEADGVDLSNVDLNEVYEVTKRLNVSSRVDFIVEKMNFFGYEGEYLKCLAFCISNEHAEYMAKEFNQRGIRSVALSGGDATAYREECAALLQKDSKELEVIFTVNIFNEGIDIPAVNLILMLRPTNSPIIFVQQLGRGLRKYEDKEFVTVLDFIGNHNRAYLISIALKGSKYYDKDSLKVSVKKDFSDYPGDTFIRMDKIAKERILEQLEIENFNDLKYLKEEYMQVKIQNGNRPLLYLMDYISFDDVIDPLRFLQNKSIRTYLNFLQRMEKNESIKRKVEDEKFMSLIYYLSSFLPLKRPHEFAVLRKLIKQHKVNFNEIRDVVEQYTVSVSEESLRHAIDTLNFRYYDSAQVARWSSMVELSENAVILSNIATKYLARESHAKIIEDIISYGLYRYHNEFGTENYQFPFLKLYMQYTMQDLAPLMNVEKKFSSYRGQGLIVEGNEYLLFVDLHKGEDVKESVNYKDKLLDEKTFQWESPNATKLDSDRGQNIIKNKERGINLHLFLRKYKEIDNSTQPYIYVGKIDTYFHKNEKPILIHARLENPLPQKIYEEFTTETEKKN